MKIGFKIEAADTNRMNPWNGHKHTDGCWCRLTYGFWTVDAGRYSLIDFVLLSEMPRRKFHFSNTVFFSHRYIRLKIGKIFIEISLPV